MFEIALIQFEKDRFQLYQADYKTNYHTFHLKYDDFLSITGDRKTSVYQDEVNAFTQYIHIKSKNDDLQLLQWIINGAQCCRLFKQKKQMNIFKVAKRVEFQGKPLACRCFYIPKVTSPTGQQTVFMVGKYIVSMSAYDVKKEYTLLINRLSDFTKFIRL